MDGVDGGCEKSERDLIAITMVLRPGSVCKTLSQPLGLQGLAVKFPKKALPKHRGITQKVKIFPIFRPDLWPIPNSVKIHDSYILLCRKE